MGFLVLKGEGLELLKLDTLQGNVSIKGHLKSFSYVDDVTKKDKENSNSLSYVFYNKKEEYHFDENLLKLHQEIDEYYNDTLSNKMSIGLLSKNKHLSIMFANNPKVHPNFVFKHKLTDEYIEALINAIIKDIKLIQNIASR